MAKINVLFICTGNTCRSPMAEGLFNKLVQEKGVDAYAQSCGIAVFDDEPATSQAIIAAAGYGVDLSPHIARQVSVDLLDVSDLIFCMSHKHLAYLSELFPSYADRMSVLTDSDISDPFSRGLEDYHGTAKLIYSGVVALLDTML